MRVEFLTHRDFQRVKPFTGVQSIRSKLLKLNALVVFDKDRYLGVLSAKDLSKKPHNLVIDCVTEKPPVTSDNLLSEALTIMTDKDIEVLPVWKNDVFQGLIFKNDILEYLKDQTEELEKRVVERTRELEKSIKIAQENDSLKSAFLANLSHEIRTPLNGILGFSEFLMEPGLNESEIRNYAQIINKSCTRLFSIIDDVLLMSKLETGQLKFHRSVFNLNQLISDIFTFYQPLANKKSIELNTIVGASDEGSYVDLDEVRIRQVFDNLITNALKFTHSGDIEFGYTINEEGLRCFVKDTGMGIRPEHHDKIFERFQQVEPDYLNNIKGIGLGLSISKSLVELMGGTMGLYSEYNAGTEFFFTLPIRPHSIEKDEKFQPESISGKKLNSILIVDDEPINLMLLETIISKENSFQLFKAENGKQAIELCLKHSDIGLVFMDIKMPVMNGIEASEIIKSKRPDVVIIAQSAYTSEQDKNTALKAGCADFLSKPISQDALWKIIKSFRY